MSDNLDNEIRYCLTSIEFNPVNEFMWSKLGLAYFRKGNLERAEACQKKALEFCPQYSNAMIRLADVLMAQGE